jgi:eukaryotic-like serine/threonine-protein kinase
VNTQLSGGLGQVVETMMAKDRSVRYATPQDLLIDLKNLLQGKPPMLAGQSLSASAMAQLADGDTGEGFFEDDFPREERPAEFHGAMEKMAEQVNFFRTLATILGLLFIGAMIAIVVLLTQR